MGKGKLKVRAAASKRKVKRSVLKAPRVPPYVQQTVEELRSRFRKKFGRDPSPQDPLFFDPQAAEPVPISREALNEMWERLADSLFQAGHITADAAHAMKKTGLLVSDRTAQQLTDAERNAWQAALYEYKQNTTGLVQKLGETLPSPLTANRQPPK